MENQKEHEANRPEKRFASGAISAAIWRNEGLKDGQVSEFHSITIGRSFKDKDGKWKTTQTLRVSDLPRASLVIGEAYKYLAMNKQEAES